MAEYDTQRLAQARTGAATRADIDVGLREYMSKVYGIMATGMAVTAFFALGLNMLAVQGGQLTSIGIAVYTSPLKWVLMFAPLLMVFAFGAVVYRLSTATATLVFYGFAALMGMSLSWIFMAYTGTSIASTFLATAAGFAGLSLYGYTTKRDLSGMGSFLMMGLIGLIIASIINIFLQSSAMQFAISVIGILIFAGLTAYDTQNIKNTYLRLRDSDRDFLGKAAILGALNLYLDFLNMFMFLLQFMGASND
ncbi:Bax inhibitor-1/YccA family protein [Paracoccus aerodenitrificans]|uniref:Bax inhibitor-1/YccA family protein n=1 Tax=Paracoccus aerodenitrificans TaxID=3017781 RepID=UPI0022F0B017|nr:Bax inhibitor-1/YccA family protein [Paracoccus aerodenitrificans]WBU64456.1 Bax inhibitor-1/YccA family protein [Paracoccus aerodenitrificans]